MLRAVQKDRVFIPKFLGSVWGTGASGGEKEELLPPSGLGDRGQKCCHHVPPFCCCYCHEGSSSKFYSLLGLAGFDHLYPKLLLVLHLMSGWSCGPWWALVWICVLGGSRKSADAWAKIATDCSASAVLDRENSCKWVCERGRYRNSLSELIASCREMVKFADS